ncbi:hypothetical protein [Pendulispora albinea]|uniref:Beta/gamma crystallin family protein n=1 Tax=Pendulispora albinea TaxID=2741071 RepID=A0ABZ2LZG4_9BACT
MKIVPRIPSVLLLVLPLAACVVDLDDDKVTLYSDKDYEGAREQWFDRNGRCRDVPGYANDRASSIKCDGEVTVYDHDDCRGDSRTFRCNVANLHDYGWGDRISSIRY